MKKLLVMAGILATTIPLTGCFESEESKQVRLAATEKISKDSSGHYVDSVEITGETVEPVRGHTLTTRNFIATIKPHDDAVEVYFRGFGYALVSDAASDAEKAAGVYMHASDGVSSEEQVKWNERSAISTYYSRLSELEEDKLKAVYVGSADVSAIQAEIIAKKEAAEKLLAESEERRDQIDAEKRKLSDWHWSQERRALQDAIRAAESDLREKNSVIKEGVDKEFTAELRPHAIKRDADLKKADGSGNWQQRREARRAVHDAYNEIKDKLNDKYYAIYESKELKSSPELDAAEAALDARIKEIDEQMDVLSKEESELWDTMSTARTDMSVADRFARAVERSSKKSEAQDS